ncbi:MAG: hypothetical protein JO103_07365 [Candidatus Eremiobacteraeota bacterium]|nr:hypothetical protein [Candidatus Eremiobacteraeota bacterium]MBV9409409.1 hypothetical protein [Candidatus Eremiobacteraeota bacterium]
MDRRIAVCIFLAALAVCAIVTKPRVLSWNDGSRIATVDALTANHSFRIDGSPYAVGLGDEIRFRGHLYSDKPPLLAVLGAGVASVAAPFGITLRATPGTAIYLVTLLTVGVFFALGCTYAYAFQRRLGYSPRLAAAVAASTGVGTLALPYAAVFTNHVPCGASALAGLYHIVRARDANGGRWYDTPLAGMFFALAYAFDAAGIVLALAGAIVLWGVPLRRWLIAIAAGVPVIALQVAYNVAISGSALPTVFNSGVWNDPSLPLHTWSSEMYTVYSPLAYLGFAVNLLVGARGLFSFTPLALVAAYGLVVMRRAGGLQPRLALAIAATFAVYFVLIVFLQNDVGARNFGERRYVDLFFVLGIALGPALASVRTRAARIAVRLALAASVAIAALGTVAPFAGAPGESGFAFGTAEFGNLAHRAPIQAGLDVVLLVLAITLVLYLVPLPARPQQPQRA